MSYPTIFTAIDLEMNQPSKQIIQLGWCIGDVMTNEIFVSRNITIFTNEEISPFITELTGITGDDCGNSDYDLFGAFELLVKDHTEFKAFRNPLTWGGGDSLTLANQLKMTSTLDDWPFGRRWIDVKTVFITYQLASCSQFLGGLKKSMKRVGLNFEGEPHRAETDAINTFRMYCKLLELMR